MVHVQIVLRDGALQRVTSRGHAAAAGGMESAPCAAVSVALKSFGLILMDHGCTVHGAAPAPGEFDLRCDRCDDLSWYTGAADMLRAVIAEVERDWPDQVTVQYSEEKTDGT